MEKCEGTFWREHNEHHGTAVEFICIVLECTESMQKRSEEFKYEIWELNCAARKKANETLFSALQPDSQQTKPYLSAMQP